MSPHEMLNAMMQLSAQFGFRETSVFRGRASNEHPAIKGAKYSAHRFWVGHDVILEVLGQKAEFVEAARRLGVRVLDEGDHLHCQPWGWEAG